MPLAELQAEWVAELLSGGRVPPLEVMRERVDDDRARKAQRYVASPRHTIQVDFYPYRRLLKAEIEWSRQRADLAS